MDTDNKILACVDHSHFADYVADYAAWAAARMVAPLEFLHVIDRHPEIATGNDHSGAIGFDAQDVLLAELSDQDEARSKTAREKGRLLLNRLRQRAEAAGVAHPDVRQRYGELEETLVEQQSGVRILVLGRRGKSAETTHRDLGRNVERVVRALRTPILSVSEAFREPQRVLIAFDGGSVTRRGIQMLAGCELFRGLSLHLVMSGKQQPDAEKQLTWAAEVLRDAGFEATTAWKPGDAEHVIASSVRDLDIDLLVMGAYSHSPLRSLLMGSKTSDLLRATKVPTLLLR